MTVDFPEVTALTLCYNHERFVRECLDSIKAQGYPNLEILIADDCSKDSSREKIRAWIAENPQLRVRFVPSEQNRGICKVLNHLLSLATGKYISLIATDDVWQPDKIASQVEMLEKLPERVGVLYSDAHQIDEQGRLLPKRFIESHREFRQPPEGDLLQLLWIGNFIPAMTTLIRRSVFDKVGKYDENLFYEDWDMWLRVAEQYHFAYQATPMAKYRVVSTSMSKSSVDRMNLANELMFIKHLLNQKVPGSMRNQAINFAIRKCFRDRQVARDEGRKLLGRLMKLYRHPRVILGWFLYVCGLDYRVYESSLNLVKRATGRQAVSVL